LETCEVCGKEELLPFRCVYCGRHFCSDHRLPENHECSGLWRAKPPIERTWVPKVKKRTPIPSPHHVSWPRIKLSLQELRHLGLGALLVALVGMSLTGWFGPIWFLGASALIFLAAFILHEMAHKFVAQWYGLWAEFRLDPFGALITAVSIFSPFKLIAPGAVVIAGFPDSSMMGRVAVAGPLTNLVLVVLLLPFFLLLPQGWGSILVSYGIYVNAIIAFFNLIPFSMLDGKKIMLWNRAVWAALFTVSLILLLLSWFRL